MTDLTPSRGYLVQALFDWLLDNDLTPHIAVNAQVPETQVPVQFVKDGQITLNIAPSAVRDLFIDHRAISFSARFAGTPMQVYVPMAAVMAIFARENGEGMGFGMEPGAEALALQAQQSAVEVRDEPQTTDQPAEAKPKPKGRPGLRVVK